MRRHRTTAVLLVLAGLVAAVSSTPASGSRSGAVPQLVFPLVGKYDLWDNWGDPRPQGSHEGIDIAAPRRAPLVAVEAGRVEYATSGLGGCMLYLYGQSGTMYLYIHLNNDVTPANDNRGGCKRGTAYAVRDGARVTAGEHIAMTGDSGDQDGNPGLHFEVHPNGGEDVNPFKHLKRASRPLFAARSGDVFSLALRGKLVAAGAGVATLEIDQVRQYPGGRWLDIEARDLDLTVPLGTDVEPFDQLAGDTLRPLKKPADVTAYTLKANATLGAIVGAPGALLLGRVAPTP
jgi:hypothetical protein